MRRFLRLTIGSLFTLTVLVCGAFLFMLYRAPVFRSGESYTFYLGASSSARAVSSTSPVLDKLILGDVAGESVQYSGDKYEELKERFRAELLFTEEACGVTNYYLYSPLLKNAVELNGKTVNLHIAVSGEKTAAGTPLIFGGF